MDCAICCETFNKSLNTPVKCENTTCGFVCCKTCVRTYLLGTTNDPHCMSCKTQWTDKFLVDNLNRAFIDNDYKKHRKSLLVNREISRTAELMPIIEHEKQIELKAKKVEELELEASKAYNTYVVPISNKASKARSELYKMKNKGVSTERRKFIMPCPASDCKGFLSGNYKCGLCHRYTCPECFELKGLTKDCDHVCSETNLKSAELIKKETKACPQCGVRIFKISGCDQMWCTECKVAFNWSTGKIVVSGTIHNPHYYEYQRRTGSAVRNPGDVVCGGLVEYGLYHNCLNRVFRGAAVARGADKLVEDWIKSLPSSSNSFYAPETEYVHSYFEQNNITNVSEFINIISSLHRIVAHVTHVDVVRFRTAVQNNNNFDNYTLDFIREKKTKDELATSILRADNIRKKNNDLLNIYEIISASGIELFNTCYNQFVSGQHAGISIMFVYSLVDSLEHYKMLLDYCNDQLTLISYTYKNTVSIIVSDEKHEFKIGSKKACLVEVNKINDKLDAAKSAKAAKAAKAAKSDKGKSKAKVSYVDANDGDDGNISD